MHEIDNVLFMKVDLPKFQVLRPVKVPEKIKKNLNRTSEVHK